MGEADTWVDDSAYDMLPYDHTMTENIASDIGDDNSNGEIAIDGNTCDNDPEQASTDNDITEMADGSMPLDVNNRPKAKMYIRYALKDGSSGKGKVLSRQPKKNGKWGHWLNIKPDESCNPISLNWKDVMDWQELEEPDKEVYFTASEEMTQEVVDAKDKELQNLMENGVFEAVEDVGQSRVTCKWVFTTKEMEGEKIVKARLVARGFEEGILNTRTDSPTCSRQSLRFCFATAAMMNWEIHSLDISSAFLQGNNIKREVYLQPPVEFHEEGFIWKLQRCVYGLRDAPRAWYDRIEKELLDLDGRTSKYDDAMFLWYKDNSLIGMIVSHVDDFIYVGTSDWHEKVIGQVRRDFKISALNQGSFKYVGLNVVQTHDAILVDQDIYINKLEPIVLTFERFQQKDEPLTKEEISKLKSISGQILWATSQTRPDAMFDSCIASNYGKHPTVRNIIQANKVIKKLKSTQVKLVFPNLGDPQKLKVITYADAAHANLSSGASQGGLLVFLAGNGRIAPMIWQSKKISRVTKSPFASETLAQAESADSGVLIAKMTEEIFNVQTVHVECRTDSKSLIDHLKSSHVIQDSRLRVDIARIKEMIKINEICMKWVSGQEQLADPMTKAGASSMKLLEVLQNGRL